MEQIIRQNFSRFLLSSSGHNQTMASAELRRLWKLHLIDVAIYEIRARAASLDPGKKILAEIEALKKTLEDKGGRAKTLSAELQDLELQQKSADDKIAKIDKELYSGKVVNPREVENYEKELESLRKNRGSHDERILELWELVPPAKAEAEKIEKALEAKRAELAEHQKKAVALKNQLESSFKQRMAERPAAAKEVDANLLAKYEAIRKKLDGVGMAEVIKRSQCGACGTLLPERTLQACLDDKVVTCESCHRILYYTEGVI
ncbi:MAG: hypothetical protein BGO01_15460 [Armatimonadetes bacterium 55-13]|nr:MAG: hypothetical protein BGO01_15460 [Armatimonadetes bacterium 55-13]